MLRSIQQSLFDPATRETQPHELSRVRGSIATLVLAWLRERQIRNKSEFHLSELEAYLMKREVGTTPGSGGRILRLLRSEGVIDYVVLHRSKSLYRITRLSPSSSSSHRR